MKAHLEEKQLSLIWALSIQGYTHDDIKTILGTEMHRTTITRKIAKMPEGWQPKWKKVD